MRIKKWSFYTGQLLRHTHFSMAAVLLGALIIAFITFKDYGITWDEPLFYQYADAVPYAYSIKARLSGDFNIENAYGPSIYDHKMYGPPYLLAARPIVVGLSWILKADAMESWHLVNFLFYLVGVWFFYLLCRRWISTWAACAAAIFFTTQPLLWGHGFINPKDIPFMVLFIMSVYAGFKLVDGSVIPSTDDASLNEPDIQRLRLKWPCRLHFWRLAGGMCLIIIVILIIFTKSLTTGITTGVEYLYFADPESLPGAIFSNIAPNSSEIPIEDYVHKAVTLFGRAQTILLWLSIPVTFAAGLVTLFPKVALSLIERFETSPLGPLPRLDIQWKSNLSRMNVGYVLLAGFSLGALISIRIIAPLAGAVIMISYLLRVERRTLRGIFLYFLVTLICLYAVWPFLWDAPIERFMTAVRYMSNVTNTKPVLFNGQVFMSNEMPASYLPTLLGFTLTEPTWLLFWLGLGLSLSKIWKKQIEWRTYLTMLAWFIIPFAYILIIQPPMYDGFRHFLFLLPPIFIVSGIFFQGLVDFVRKAWARNILVLACLAPGMWGIFSNHPYQYTYYNAFTSGTGGAFRRYETDYWLTCYKEIMQQLDSQIKTRSDLYVLRQPAVARHYAAEQFNLLQYEPEGEQPPASSLLLLSTRSNADLNVASESPIVAQVVSHGAVFCLVKQIK